MYKSLIFFLMFCYTKFNGRSFVWHMNASYWNVLEVLVKLCCFVFCIRKASYFSLFVSQSAFRAIFAPSPMEFCVCWWWWWCCCCCWWRIICKIYIPMYVHYYALYRRTMDRSHCWNYCCSRKKATSEQQNKKAANVSLWSYVLV